MFLKAKLAILAGMAVMCVGSANAADIVDTAIAAGSFKTLVAAVKADKAGALDMFNRGEGGFLDLHPFCANVSDGSRKLRRLPTGSSENGT